MTRKCFRFHVHGDVAIGERGLHVTSSEDDLIATRQTVGSHFPKAAKECGNQVYVGGEAQRAAGVDVSDYLPRWLRA
jgi:hypothetical protein